MPSAMKVSTLIVLLFTLIVGVACSEPTETQQEQGQETQRKQGQEQDERTKVIERTVIKTVEAPERTGVEEQAVPEAPEEPAPEETLALQYQYLNEGNYDAAYNLFTEQSKQLISLEQYRAWFENAGNYQITNFSFPTVQVEDNTATVVADLIAISDTIGVDQYQRTQEMQLENGSWRVVIRDEQVELFAGTEGSTQTPEVQQSGELLQVGETANLDSIQVTINEVYRTYGDDFDQGDLESGEVYVVMDTTISNEGDTTPYIDTINWTLYDQDGYELESAYVSALESTPEYSGDLRPGRQFSGPIAVVASESDTLIAEYIPDEAMFDEDIFATWDIGAVSALPLR